MGKKRSSTTRTNISLPADVKRRMEKVKEAVNWSALACRAFEDKLGEIATQKEKKTMTDVIDRLRKSKRESNSEVYQEGFESGAEWAKSFAEARELEALQECYDSLGCDRDKWFSTVEGKISAHSTAELVYFAMHNEEEAGRDDSDEFWTMAAGEHAPYGQSSFVRGFVEGALEVWGEVKGEL